MSHGDDPSDADTEEVHAIGYSLRVAQEDQARAEDEARPSGDAREDERDDPCARGERRDVEVERRGRADRGRDASAPSKP